MPPKLCLVLWEGANFVAEGHTEHRDTDSGGEPEVSRGRGRIREGRCHTFHRCVKFRRHFIYLGPVLTEPLRRRVTDDKNGEKNKPN